MVYLLGSKSKGLGDTIAKVTTVTGIKKAVETVSRALNIEDCGCDKRQDQLNKLFPYANPETTSK